MGGAHQQWPGADNTSQPKPHATFYTGLLQDEEAVMKFVEQHRFPGVWHLGESSFFEFTHAGRSAAIIAVDPAAVSTQQERMVQAVAYKLKGDYLFGVVDGTSWGDALRDFNIAPKKLPRVFVTVDDFEGWYEDIDLLQLNNIEADLRGLTSGEKQILRSSRSPW